jgi:hypothetical protein
MARVAAISLWFVALLGCLTAFCTPEAEPSASKEPVYSDSEGYTILSKLIDQTVSQSKVPEIDISFVTASEGNFAGSEGCVKVPEDFQPAAKDFHEKNKSRFRLVDKFSLKVKYKLTEKPDVPSPPQAAPGEQQLEDEFVSRLFFVVSAVGFDRTKTHAIAYVSAYCGVMCAGGAYHLLTKDKQGWKEIPDSPRCEWMSQEQDSANSRGTS